MNMSNEAEKLRKNAPGEWEAKLAEVVKRLAKSLEDVEDKLRGLESRQS